MRFLKATHEFSNKTISVNDIYDQLLDVPMFYVPIWTLEPPKEKYSSVPADSILGNLFVMNESHTIMPISKKKTALMKFRTFSVLYIYTSIDGINLFFNAMENLEEENAIISVNGVEDSNVIEKSSIKNFQMLTFDTLRDCFTYLLKNGQDVFDILCIDGMVLALEDVDKLEQTKGTCVSQLYESLDEATSGLYLTKVNMKEAIDKYYERI